jgi:hypothetical protein
MLRAYQGGRRKAEELSESKKKHSSAVPASFAKVLLSKFAEDALNPAKIHGGDTPELQSIPGVPSSHMQGSTVGELTPRETAPSTGQGAGRGLIESIEAAMNYTKGQAKAPQKAALSEVLTEPALSAAHDNVLQRSLDNTSEAGVKISAARREMLKKLAASSPAAKKQLMAMIKAAENGEPIPPPGQELAGAAQAVAPQVPPVSDAALQAASEGVTPDQLVAAQHVIAEQAAQAALAAHAAATPAVGVAPAGAEGVPVAEAAPAQA